MKLIIYILLFAFTNISSIGVFHHHNIDYNSNTKLTNTEDIIDCKLCELIKSNKQFCCNIQLSFLLFVERIDTNIILESLKLEILDYFFSIKAPPFYPFY